MDRVCMVSSTHQHRTMTYRTNIIHSTSTMGKVLVPMCRAMSMANNNISSPSYMVLAKGYKASLVSDIILVPLLLLSVGPLRRRINHMLPKAKILALAWELDKLALAQLLREGQAFSNLNKPHSTVGI